MCYLLQTEYVRVIAVDELNNSIEVAVVALVDPAVDVVGGDPQPLAHPPHHIHHPRRAASTTACTTAVL